MLQPIQPRLTLPRRRLLIGTAGALAGLAALPPAVARAATLATTPRQTEGPFYPLELPSETDADLVRLTGADAQALGEVTHVTGRVLDRAGRPLPGAVVEILPNSGHFPHKDHPDRFVKIVQDFIRATQPASYHRGRWRQLLRNGPALPSNRAEAGEAPLAPVAQLPKHA